MPSSEFTKLMNKLDNKQEELTTLDQKIKRLKRTTEKLRDELKQIRHELNLAIINNKLERKK